MPFTRPAEISNGVSLSDKVGRAEFAFVAEDGAVDPLLVAVVDELPPNKHCISVSGSEHDVLSGADKLESFPSVLVVIATVMPLVEFKTTLVPVLRNVPIRHRCTSPMKTTVKYSSSFFMIALADFPQERARQIQAATRMQSPSGRRRSERRRRFA